MADLLTLAALRALVTFSDPELSPDGTRIAVVRTTQDFANDELPATIVVHNVSGGAARTLASGEGVGSPRWSPDGTRLAFLRNDKNGQAQINVIALGGGTIRAITTAANGVQHFSWSPDGTRFAYDTPDDNPRADAVKHHDDLFTIGDDGMLIAGPARPSHLWIVGAAGGTAHRLTHGTWSYYEGVPPFAGATSDPSWSHDGRSILFTKSADAHTAVTERTTIAIADVSSGHVRDLSSIKRYEYEPLFAPNAHTFVYLRPHGPHPSSALEPIVASSTTGVEAERAPHFDRDISAARWAADGSLVVIATDHLQPSLFRIPANGTAHRIDTGNLVPSAFSIARDGTIAFTASTWSHPSELFVIAHGAKPRALTNANTALAAKAYGRAEPMQWHAPDGEINEGLLVHPAAERPGKRYPLVVWSHGGPQAAISTAWTEGTDEALPIGALLAARGAYVLMPNYRGSDDLGSEHEASIFGDPAYGPSSDIRAGIDTVLASAPIDTSRICIAGHSYGGFMTAWLAGHDTRWKCAVVADGAVDLALEYNLSGTGNLAFTRDSIGGSPWDPQYAQLYHDASAVNSASAIRTPTLIITGLSDEVVPYGESFELYHAIKEHGVPVQLVGIPTAHHTPSDPVRLEGYARTITSFIIRSLSLTP